MAIVIPRQPPISPRAPGFVRTLARFLMPEDPTAAASTLFQPVPLGAQFLSTPLQRAAVRAAVRGTGREIGRGFESRAILVRLPGGHGEVVVKLPGGLFPRGRTVAGEPIEFTETVADRLRALVPPTTVTRGPRNVPAVVQRYVQPTGPPAPGQIGQFQTAVRELARRRGFEASDLFAPGGAPGGNVIYGVGPRAARPRPYLVDVGGFSRSPAPAVAAARRAVQASAAKRRAAAAVIRGAKTYTRGR